MVGGSKVEEGIVLCRGQNDFRADVFLSVVGIFIMICQ